MCFVELFWMFSVFCSIILDFKCVLLNYFGCSVCFVELFWGFRLATSAELKTMTNLRNFVANLQFSVTM